MPKAKQPNPIDIEVGRRIRTQRLASRISQTALGQKVGVTFQQVQKYEKGVNRVGAGRLQQIADVLGVPVDFFFDKSRDGRSPATEVAETSFDFLQTAGAVRLVRAYSEIQDPELRRSLVTLAESIAGQQHR